jgi:hypothetical protein
MSITNDDRATARLGDIEFAFEHPQLDSSGAGKAVKHEVVPIDENDDAATVIQPMGRKARDWTLRGTCYKDTADALDNMTGDVVELRHSRHSGDVYVDDVSTNPASVEDETGWRYTYTVSLTEVV